MTYDRVKFAMNQHHYKERRNSESRGLLSGEKCNFAPAKPRRRSFSFEPVLHGITEPFFSKHNNSPVPDIMDHVTAKRDVDVYSSGSTDTDRNFREFANMYDDRHSGTYSVLSDEVETKFGEGGEDDGKRELERSAEMSGDFCESSDNDRPQNKNESVSSNSSVERSSKKRSECDTGRKNSNVNSRESNTSKPDQCGKVKLVHNSKNQTVPKLDLGAIECDERNGNVQEENVDRTAHQITGKDYSEDKENDNVNEYNQSFKLPSVHTCEHMVGNTISTVRDGKFNKKSKLKKGVEESDKCVICEITEATAKYASVEANRLLMEIVYPHEFYDKFQRSRKSKATIPKTFMQSKDRISICRPAKVSPKLGRRERTSVESLAPGPETGGQLNTTRGFYRNWYTDRSEDDNFARQKIARKDIVPNVKKEIHVQCKAGKNAVVITDDSEGQKLVLKGLKGWSLKKDDSCKNKEHREIKKSLYQVNSLGIKFSIPEYNISLHDRAQQQSPRPTTSYVTTSPDTESPIKRPITHCMSPPRIPFRSKQARDIRALHERGLDKLHRSYTFGPKLFSEVIPENATPERVDLKPATNSSQSESRKSLTLYKQNTRFSLPPIGLNMKSRSLTLSHF